MNIADLLSIQRVVCGAQVASKKRAIELLSQLLASSNESLIQVEVFESLLCRERLGSTGLGHGVAIPHGRMAGLTEAVAAFVQLGEGVDYDSIDQQPVDLLYALLVPQEATDAHLQILASLAEIFKDPDLRERLRQAETAEELHALLTRSSIEETSHAESPLI